MNSMKLNEGWLIRHEPLHVGPEKANEIRGRQSDWMAADLPCDIHMPLIREGIIPEPLVGMNSLECLWTEKKSWWFQKRFDAGEDLLECDSVELNMDMLDAEADIFLNGVHLGHHRSAFYSFVANVKETLRSTDNVLLVRLTSGLEHYSEQDISAFANHAINETTFERGDQRRLFVRKPQYAYGWDWGPRVPTCGIMSDVSLAGYRTVAIRGVRAYTKKADTRAEVGFAVEIENLHPYSTCEAEVTINVTDGDLTVMSLSRQVVAQSGINFIDLEGVIDQAKLWWPNGMGEQHLYKVNVNVSAGDVDERYPPFGFGVRTVRLNQDSLGVNERLFAIEINGVRTFCKGANWVPADSIYARVTDGKYAELLEEAKQANFTMLRVWGGGLYERNYFYEKCDELGLMVWQDFMFACGLYPDHLEWFREETEKEIDYQTRRLRNHASLVLWCGNNENHWAMDIWKTGKMEPHFFGGQTVYNQIAPSTVRHNSPDIPYWASSPYGGADPNGFNMGDCHQWRGLCGYVSEETERRITPEDFDQMSAKFVSEYGYIGTCRESSIAEYHGEFPVDQEGEIWKYHSNTVLSNGTMEAGIAKHYADPDSLTLTERLLYSGLCQGLMYGYSLESFRSQMNCSGSLFWMYNDTWGEHGWSIIDYYLKRKISYYFVKWAFAPVKLVMRQSIDGIVHIYGINETAHPIAFEAEYGYVSFDGQVRETDKAAVRLDARTRTECLSFHPGDRDFSNGICFIKPMGEDIPVLSATLRKRTFRELKLPPAKLTASDWSVIGGETRFRITSATFAHAVHFGLDDRYRLSDEYFDLLPGESREVVIQAVSHESITLDSLSPRCLYTYEGSAAYEA